MSNDDKNRHISRAPDPIKPLRGSGRTDSLTPTRNVIDGKNPRWDKWRHVPEAEIWEAVALSLNIEPSAVPNSDSLSAEMHLCGESDDFKDRIFIANRNAGAPALPWKSISKVSLRDFAAWALSLNWGMPPELEVMAVSSKQTSMHFAMTIPAEKKFLSVREIPSLTARTMYPDAQTEAGRVITNLLKQGLENCIPAPRPVPLTTDDWVLLETTWADLPSIRFPLPESQWEQYAQAFANTRCPPEWRVIPLVRDESHNQRIQRVTLQQEHERQLSAAIQRQEVRPVHPLTHLVQNFTVGNADKDALIPANEFIRFAATLAIEVTTAGAEKQSVESVETPLGERERDKLLKLIGALACVLARKVSRYNHGDSPNVSQIASAVKDEFDAFPDLNIHGLGDSSLREIISAGIDLLKK